MYSGKIVLSQLTAFTRCVGGGRMIDRASPVMRQNHPGFAGLVCPVETPESKHVGMVLHAARELRCDESGAFRAGNGDEDLGFRDQG